MRRATVIFTTLAFALSGIGFASPANADAYDGTSGTIDCSSGTVSIVENVVIDYDNCAGDVVIPSGVTGIDEYAFENAIDISSISIPASVTSIGEGAFAGTTTLSSVYFLGNAPSTADDAFSGAAQDAKAFIKQGASDFAAPGENWYGLIVESFIPDGTYLCSTGQESSSTPNFTITNSEVSLGGECDGDAVIPSGVASIGDNAFYNASSLNSVTIPASVINIGQGAFDSASSLSSVYFLGNAPSTADDAFSGVAQGAKAFIKPGASDFAAPGDPWYGLIVEEHLPNGTYPCAPGSESSATFTINELVVSEGSQCVGDVTIPNGVTTIGENAFKGATEITSITIPSSVTNIGDYAFSGVTSLGSVTIPSSVTGFGIAVFKNVTSLNSIYFLGNAPTVGGDQLGSFAEGAKAFIKPGATGFVASGESWNGLIVEVFFPDGTYSCTTGVESSLTPNFTMNDGYLSDGKQCDGDFVIPSGVTAIGSSAFNGSTLITSITFPATVTSIGESAFTDAASLSRVYFLGNAPSTPDDAFSGVAQDAKAFIKPGATDFAAPGENWYGLIVEEHLPNGTYPCAPESESSATFTIKKLVVSEGSKCIGEVVIPRGVTEIAGDAFWEAVSITSITIPATVTSIGDYAFYDATSLSNIYFLGDAPTVGNQAFHNTALGATGYIKPEAIGFVVAEGKWNEIYVDVLAPDGTYVCTTGDQLIVEEPTEARFLSGEGTPGEGTPGEGTPEEESESTPVFTILNGFVFDGWGCMGDVKIPEGVAGLGASAFENSELTSIALPTTLRSIGETAFANITSLTAIEIPDRVASIGKQAFDYATSLKSVVVSSKNVSYKSTSNVLFNKLGTTLVLYPSSKSGTSYSIPVTVTKIGHSAFSDTALTSITIPPSVKTIEERAFIRAAELTSITIPAGVTTIEDDAFEETTSLASYSVVSANTKYSSIAGVLFNKIATDLISYPAQKSDTSYAIPATVTEIGNKAFYNTGSLTSISIPASVTTIGHFAFYSSPSLENVTFANGSKLLEVGENAFTYAQSLSSIILPASIETIGDSAFLGASGLAEITIPASVTYLGSSAFAEASSLRSVRFLGDAPNYVGFAPFLDVDPLATAYVKSGAQGFDLEEGTWKGLIISEYDFIASFNSNGGTVVNVDLFNSDGTIQRAPISTRTGYTLAGWSRTNGGSVVKFPYSPNASTDITLFAKWNKNPVKAVAKTKPSITGKAIETVKGTNKLTANKGVWSGDPTPEISYQWYSCTAQVKATVETIPKTCKKISGATKMTLALKSSLKFKGKFIAVAVTAKVAGTTPTVWLSKSTAKVK